jgi:hypothetical protein
VNICHDGGSLLTFTDSWASRNEPQANSLEPADTEWLDYCRARELAERAAAKRASSIEARRIHQELAEAYARRARRAGD